MSNTKKWLCEYCTYENFPSSRKCTMCNCQKALLNEDIFRYNYKIYLCPLVYTRNNRTTYCSLSPSQQCDNNQSIIEASSLSLSTTNLTASCGPSNQESTVNTSSLSTTTTTTKNTPTKWTCSNCTYLNMSKTTSRCVQCATTKRTESELNMFNEQMKSLNLAEDQELLATSNRISPMGSATNLSGSRTNLGAGARISPVEQRSYPLNKWMCTVSTRLQFFIH